MMARVKKVGSRTAGAMLLTFNMVAGIDVFGLGAENAKPPLPFRAADAASRAMGVETLGWVDTSLQVGFIAAAAPGMLIAAAVGTGAEAVVKLGTFVNQSVMP